MSVRQDQRFTKTKPCPVCGGFDGQARGSGRRCAGFLSDDGDYAHCTREEQAGQLAPSTAVPPTFPHRLEGACGCGHEHAPARWNGGSSASSSSTRRIVAEYDYVDERGTLLYQAVRYDPKNFSQRRPDGNGGWIWKLDDTPRVLYRLPIVLGAIKLGAPIYIAEGEKDVHAIEDVGAAATTCPMGAGKWRHEFSKSISTATSVRVIADRDDEGRKHAATVAASLREAGVADVEIVEPAEGKDASDHLAAGRTLDELVPLAVAEPGAIDEVLKTFRRWLHLPDPAPLLVVLGAVAANMREGDPIWLVLVGPPGGGKSEILQSVAGLPDVHPSATLTEAALLSGSPNRERASDSKGGLLRSIGDFGIILAKDFGSVLNMNRDARAAVLAALREVYDGSWTRHVGTDGGRTLAWSGKVGLIAGCTPTIDRHHGVMNAMGERFVLFRLPSVDSDKQARRALAHAGKERTMRAELAEAASRLLEHRHEPAELKEHEIDRLIALATLAVRCRSAVERDGYSREIELIPESEAPTRLVVVLSQLLGGLDSIGVDRSVAWRVVTKAAMDSIPATRHAVMDVLMASETSVATTAIAESLGYPTPTAKRALEDLTAHGIAFRASRGSGQRADTWTLTTWARERYAISNSEMSEALISSFRVDDDFSESQTPEASA